MQNQPLEHTQVLFVATDAEELGNLGGEDFIKQNQTRLDKNSTYFLIVDSIGCKKDNRMVAGSIIPNKKYSPALEKIGDEILASAIPKYPLHKFHFPPFLAIQSDHNPVLDNHYEFLLFGGVSLDYHTPRDNLDAIDRTKFFQICDFLECLVRKNDIQ